jgi:hypothetical protein
VRRAFTGVHALCAATASEYLIRAGVLGGYRPWTSQLESALKERGWMTVGTGVSLSAVGTRVSASAHHRYIETVADSLTAVPTPDALTGVPTLRTFDLCYSIDANGNGAPDHVFFFISWFDRARLVAEVVDNYAPHPHPRNLGAPCWYGGRRLAYGKFDHAQRFAEQAKQ